VKTSQIILLISAALLFPLITLAQESKAHLYNDASLEGLGKNFLYSFMYQRLLSQHFGVELGFSLLPRGRSSVLLLSGGARLYILKSDASPYLNAGIVVVTENKVFKPFDNEPLFAYAGPGFEYRFSGGLILRAMVYFFIGVTPYIWPGSQIGVAF